MTVGELIKELSKFDKTLTCRVADDDCDLRSLEHIIPLIDDQKEIIGMVVLLPGLVKTDTAFLAPAIL